MNVSINEALAVNVKEYCQLLVKTQEECKDTLLGVEKELLTELIRKLYVVGIPINENPNGLGNTFFLKLKPGSIQEVPWTGHSVHLGEMELDFDQFHPAMTDLVKSAAINQIAHSIQRLHNLRLPEPAVEVLLPLGDTLKHRHVTVEWAEWFISRYPHHVTAREVGLVGGQRIYELMDREEKGVVKVGESLKVSVTCESSKWDGKPIPVRLFRVIQEEIKP